MKINDKDESLMIPYEEIHVGECFEYNGNNYMKCRNDCGNIYDVNLETGRITADLVCNETPVKFLKNGTFYKYGGKINEN